MNATTTGTSAGDSVDSGRGGGIVGWLAPVLGVAVAAAVGVAAVSRRGGDGAAVALPDTAGEGDGGGEEAGPFQPPEPPPGASFSIEDDPERV